MLPAPIFLVGAERSGTTMLRLMLGHHSQLAWVSEFEYAVDRVPATDGWPNLEAYYEWLSTNRAFLVHGFTIDRSLTYPQLVNSFLQQRQQTAQKPLIGATVHRHFDRLLRIWPDARLIHIVRDGRDVARSNIKMGWAGNPWTGSIRWQQAEQLWDRCCDRIPPDQRLDLTYEDLIKTPETILRQICSFLQMPYDAAMFNYADQTVYNRPDPAYLDQWRQKLSPAQIQLVEARIGDLLIQRGYPLSGHPPRSVKPPLQLWLKLQDRLSRARFRINRYGLGLTLQGFLANQLGASQWQKQIKQQRHQVDWSLRRQEESRILATKGIPDSAR